MVPLVESALKDLQIGNGTGVFEPQFELNGDENIWIVKPACNNVNNGSSIEGKRNQMLHEPY